MEERIPLFFVVHQQPLMQRVDLLLTYGAMD